MQHERFSRLSVVIPLAIALLSLSVQAAAPAAPAAPASPAAPLDPQHAKKMAAGLEVFKADVRQIFLDACVKCHGGEKTKADFDMTTRELLIKGGETGAGIVPGNPRASLLYKLITHEEEPHMPQKEPKLPAAKIAKIAEWIELGAPYDKALIENAGKKPAGPMEVTEKDRQFWSFQPLKRVEPAAISGDNWSTTPIDRFIVAKLQEKKLAPNPLADKRVLIRRAYFDLIGLPPTPQEVEAFVNDKDSQAYAKLIDRLLASPHHGERWARYWLDVSRFAESHGFEQDYDRPNAYHYRDFVIKAFNADTPYDQFVRWQIAGDELAPDEPLAWMATAFLTNGVFPTQLTEKEFESSRYDELDDMAATTGSAMLGLTIGCARCHDHKFDPLPVADYYNLVATFATTIRSEVELDVNNNKNSEALAKWEQAHAPLAAELAKFEKEQLPARFSKWAGDLPKAPAAPQAWAVLDVQARSHGGTAFVKQQDGSLLATGKNPANDKWTLAAKTNMTGITAVRLEAMADKSLVKGGPGRAGNGNFALSVFKVTAAPLDNKNKSKPTPVKLISAKATFEQNNSSLSIASSIDNDNVSGWAVDPQFGKDHAAVFEFDSPVGFEGGTLLTFEFEFNNNANHSIGRPRLSVTTKPRPVGLEGNATPQNVVELLAALKAAGGADKLDAKQQADLLGWYKPLDPQWNELNQKVQAHLASKPKPQKVKVMVASENVPKMKHHADDRGFPHFYPQTYHLKRGDANQKGEVARQGFLQVLMKSPDEQARWLAAPPAGSRTSGRRTNLANWLTDVDAGAGRLLARVIVNRLWQHHLGRGIVATPNDFGFQGDRPTHPELLDWLATELIRGGWKLKPIHKLIMTSSVYMQTSDYASDKAAADPQNTLLWRQSYRRLEAEVIRDNMLAVSGELDATLFGPGTLNEGMKRRSIYFFIKRSRMISVMQLFDMPEPLVSQGARPSTTIAPQALLFMNSPHVRGYAAGFARRIAPAAARSYDDAVSEAYLTAIGRKPTTAELADNVAFLKSQQATYDAQKKGNARDLALADFCQVVMCLNEFVYVE